MKWDKRDQKEGVRKESGTRIRKIQRCLREEIREKAER